MTNRFAYKIAILTLIFVLSACAFQMVYPRLPFLIGWQIDNYLDLNDEQEDWLDARLREHLQQHREQQLPRYAEFTARLATSLGQASLDDETLKSFEAESRTLYRELMQQFNDDAVELISGLSDEQVAYVRTKMEEDPADTAEEYAEKTPEERVEERLERTIDDLEALTGPLSKEQKALVKTFVDQRPDLYVLGQATRERWQKTIDEVLQQRQQKEVLRETLQRLVMEPESLRDEAYNDAFLRYEQLRRQMYIAVFASLTKKQKQHLVDEINEWQQDFSELALVD